MNRAGFNKSKLPDSPGIYFFIDEKKEIIYIGRATSLKNRVKSYFSDDVIHTRGPIIVDMVTRAASIEYTKTDSVLEAIILEANLIKKYQPHANIKEKDDKSFNYVVITDEEFPRVILAREKELNATARYTFGPFPYGSVLREGLKIIRKIFPYRDEKCKLGKPCFNYSIGLCPGPCAGAISKKEYAKTIQNIRLFFEGRKGELLKKLEKEMKRCAKEKEFEKANDVKRQLFALTHIQDVHIPRIEYDAVSLSGGDFRIEAYDIAHMSGQNTAGVMVVLEDHHIKKSDYRLFKIKRKKGIDDVAHLREVIDRRLNHPEWPFPHLIVVDGNDVQKRAAEALLDSRNLTIPVAAVTKNDRHTPERIIGDGAIIQTHAREILLANSEAHRFAIKYHRRLRSKSML